MSTRSRARPWFAMEPQLRDLSRRVTTADMVAALTAMTKPLMQRNACVLALACELPAAFGWRIDAPMWDWFEEAAR